MTRESQKLEARTLGFVMLIWVFAFQRALIGTLSVIGYLDEVFAIFACVDILLSSGKRKSMTYNDVIIWLCMILLLAEGLISNIISDLLNNAFAIAIDIISTFKVMISIMWMKEKRCKADKIICYSASIGRAVVWGMFVLMVLSFVVDTGMSDEIRYGIKSFRFVFDNPGNYSKFFYFLIPLLVADMVNGATGYKKLMIVLACLCWMSTLRSRAFSFVAMLAVFAYLYYGKKNQGEGTFKIKWRYVIPLLLIVLYFSWDQMIYYFTTETQARAILLRYSLVTLVKYFPIGSGFGTYGSDVAANYYSELYTQYGFDHIYGMGYITKAYLNDNYWPMILGQFGLIGVTLVVIVLYKIHKSIFQRLYRHKHYFFAAACACAFLLISSVASKSYSEFSSICIFLLIGLMMQGKQSQGNAKITGVG